MRPRELESHAQPSRPQTLNNRQILVTNKAATSAKKCQSNVAKVAPNTNRHNFASNNLEYNKLKAPTLTLHVKNYKAYSHIKYKLSFLKKLRTILSLKNSEIKIL